MLSTCFLESSLVINSILGFITIFGVAGSFVAFLLFALFALFLLFVLLYFFLGRYRSDFNLFLDRLQS